MTLPIFSASDDPGPSFAELLRRTGGAAPVPEIASKDRLEITHGTTVVAVRYADGVVMAGDRRATSGNLISHRTMEKVYAADRHSGVAIAGAAGPAMDMVKLFQLQLEHYEKVEGNELSLEGKANQLSGMVRSNLPAAMQGLVVVPLFAGYDTRRRQGRLFQYDVTGGRYEETNFATTGSGSLHAGTVIKLGYRDSLNREETIDLAISALFNAADEDSATGGPDLVRGIYPTMATITDRGFEKVPRRRSPIASGSSSTGCRLPRAPRPPVSLRRCNGGDRHEHAVLRRPRAGDEGPRRLRAQGHRSRPASSPSATTTASSSSPRTRRTRCARSARSTTASPFAGVGRYSEFEQLRIAGVRHADLKGYSFSREDVDARGLANAYAQILNQVFTHEIKPLEVEILVAEVATPEGGSHDQLFHILYDGTVMDENKFSVLGGEADAITERIEASWREGMNLGEGIGVSVAALAGEERTLTADDLEVAILSRTNGRRAFRRIEGDELAALVPCPPARRRSLRRVTNDR